MYSKRNWFIDDLCGNFLWHGLWQVKNELYTFTNHLGNKPLYYYFDKEKETFIASSDLFDIVRALKELGVIAHLDELLCILSAYPLDIW